ncbi:colicin E3/pyocin S6 family cytotoxin [Paenibacillus naphthalenovorans]|uniref:colicin E3/pyocin S6 family cytotoxin n=1 Tax=Paenibacillus naphthalenovorans TaxID=162209 RepID=UPI003D29C7AA
MPKPCFLDECIYLKVIGDRKVWRSEDGRRLYTWDTLHGEIEVFNNRGFHLGSANAVTGEYIKPAVKGRRLYV